MGNRAAVQADETELSPSILLWRKRQCHQDPNLGDSYRKAAADDGNVERAEVSEEFLRTGNNGQNYSNVRCGFLHSVQ